MIDPVFFLGLSILLVAVSLTAVLVVLIPAVQELARAGRSAEKLFDTLRRELPPTLEAIRLTGIEISDLTDDMSEGVKSAGQVVKRVDDSLDGVKVQAQKVQITTRSVFTGLQAAWKTFTRNPTSSSRRTAGRLPPATRSSLEAPEMLGRPRRDPAPSDWQSSADPAYLEAEESLDEYPSQDPAPRRQTRSELPPDLVDD